jgi:autotransporter-associated beta strand protein
LYYKNITGAGTLFMGGANSTTGYVLGDSTIANLKGSGSKTISIGNGTSAGRLLSGHVQATGGLLLNSTTDYTFTGVHSVGTLTKQQANTVKLTGANTSTSAITVSAGILQVGDAGTAGSITGNASVASGASLVFSRSDAASYVGNISGAGTVSKLGANVLTLTGTQTYTGATATGAAGGGIVFTKNTLPVTPGAFTGNGTVTIQPVAAGSFGSTLSTSAYSFASSLTGLTLGRDGNTSAITVNSALNIAGPISIYGGTINLNSDITSTAANAGMLFKSAGDIAQAVNVDVLTNGGSTVYWANSDGGNSAGMVLLETGSTITTQGGHVWLGGSAAANGQTTWHGLTVGDGYAASGTSVAFAGNSPWQGGIVLKRSQISSGGGDVSLYGYGAASGSGFVNFDSSTINSGTGQILINAKSAGIVAFLPGLHPATLPNAVFELRSANTGVDAIRVITDAVATNDPGAVIEGNFQMNATNGGGVTLSGRAKAGVAGLQVGSQWGTGVMDALSTAGNVTLDAGTNSISFQSSGSAIYLGSKTGSAVTSATGNIVLSADSLSLASALTYANTTGSLTIAPTSASFTSAVNSTGWVLGSGLSALTVGSLTNTAHITWASSNTVNGPIAIYGGNITLNSAIGTTNTTTGDVLLRGANVNSAYNISLATGRTLTLDHSGSSSILSALVPCTCVA